MNIDSFLLRSTKRQDLQPGSDLTLLHLEGAQWKQAAGPVPIGPFACAGKSVQEIREFFLTTAAVDAKFGAIGQCLWASINLPEFQPVWGTAFASPLVPFRLYLDMQGELHGLPWELLTHPFGHCCVLRYEKWEAAASCEAPLWPVRLLVVVGAGQTDLAVGAEAEVAAIRTSLRAVDRSIFREVLTRPSQKDLSRAIKDFQPQVLHFIGHAGDATDGSKEPALKFDLGGGQSWDWTRASIDAVLESHTFRLVILNACRTLAYGGGQTKVAPGSMQDQDRTESLAAHFLKRARSVIAMQSDIDGLMAGAYSNAIYSRLAEGKTLDVALRSARNDVKNASNVNQRDAYAACLSLNSPPEQVICIPTLDAAIKLSMDKTKAFEIVNRFVGREKQCSDLFLAMQPPCETISAHTLYIVKAPEWTEQVGEEPAQENFQPGKTWFVHWCMESCARQGHQVRWIDVTGAPADTEPLPGGDAPVRSPESVGLVELMRSIRDGYSRENLSVLRRKLDPLAFREFNYTLNTLLAGGVLTEVPEGQDLIDDKKRPMELAQLNDERFIDRICSTFRTALFRVAEKKPLLLVLDNFVAGASMFPKPHFDIFLKQVLLTLDENEKRPVRVIVVLTDKLFRTYGLKDDLPEALYKKIDLDDLPAEAFQPVAWEYLERTRPGLLQVEKKKNLASQLVALRSREIGSWRIAYLEEYAKLMKGVIP